MILPFDRIEQRLARKCPGLPDVEGRVRARADLYANDWPPHQIAAGLYRNELMRAGVSYLEAERAAIEVTLALAGW